MTMGGEVFGKQFIGVGGEIELGWRFERRNPCEGFNVDVRLSTGH